MVGGRHAARHGLATDRRRRRVLALRHVPSQVSNKTAVSRYDFIAILPSHVIDAQLEHPSV